MTDLSRLTVSLTKHGAHKVAALLLKYEANEVLNHLAGSEPGINIELAQAQKNLSVDAEGRIPPLWNAAKTGGKETVEALVLLAIIFSHHQLIRAMAESSDRGPFAGTIRRGHVIDGKAFTNLAHIIEELSYSTEHSPDHIRFNVHRLFQIKGLSTLASQLLELKLKSAGWNTRTSVADEASKLKLNEALAVADKDFHAWLTTGTFGAQPSGEFEDADFFVNAPDTPSKRDFVFRAGHTQKRTGTIGVTPSKMPLTATLLHNKVQNELFATLVKKHGEDNVGTENDTGQGTSIDIVVKRASRFSFYEIKTASSVKACIRQALPQLLEYAYWHGAADRVKELIVVSVLPPTKEAEVYLTFLRAHFAIPISYMQHKETG